MRSLNNPHDKESALGYTLLASTPPLPQTSLQLFSYVKAIALLHQTQAIAYSSTQTVSTMLSMPQFRAKHYRTKSGNTCCTAG